MTTNIPAVAVPNNITTREPPVNPLIARARLPGQTFALPSKALFYTHGEVDESVLQTNGEVLIYPMVTLDEIAMKTPDKLLNGTALTDVFKRCIPQIIQPLQLLSKDVDFLLICLRKVTYGDEYRFDYKHDCNDTKEHSYSIPLDPLISTAKKVDGSKVNRDYTLTLPNSQVVKLSPPKYYQMLKFFQSIQSAEDDKAAQDNITHELINTTVSMIDSVDGEENKQMILEWAHAIPAGYANKIGSRVAAVSGWGTDLEVAFKCKDCDKEVKTIISLNPIDFFS